MNFIRCSLVGYSKQTYPRGPIRLGTCIGFAGRSRARRIILTPVSRFANGLSGYFGLVRSSPVYWRVHVFGDEGSVEALGETDVVLRTRGGKTERREFQKIDSVRAEIDAFADAVAGLSPYPITTVEMVNTIAALEAITCSMDTGQTVSIS